MIFRVCLDFLPLNLVYFVPEAGNVLENNISLAVETINEEDKGLTAGTLLQRCEVSHGGLSPHNWMAAH